MSIDIREVTKRFGSFTALDEPWDEADLWDVKLTLTLATQ